MDGHCAFLKIDLPLLILLWLAASYLYLTLHETGHVIAAIRHGFRILTFSVWPISLERGRGSWRVRRARRFRVAGFVAADPVTAADFAAQAVHLRRS